MKPLPNWLGKLRLLFNYRFDYRDKIKIGPTPCCILTKTSSGDFLLHSASQFVILEQTTKCDLRFSNSIYAFLKIGKGRISVTGRDYIKMHLGAL